MMKKLLIAGSVLLMNIANGQEQAQLHTGALPRNFKANPLPSLVAGVSDTLDYFWNKNYFLNTSTTNNTYWTIKNAQNSISSHHGSMFNNSTPIQVHGLEGLVMKTAGSVSSAVPVKLYLCNVSSITNLPVFPALDSVLTTISTTGFGDWVGGNFLTPVTVTGKFAVLFRNGSTTPGDTVTLFMNNAATPTSTVPANQKYGENLGVRRTNGNFASNTGYYGSGTDYEFVVSPRVSFDLDAEITVTTPTICTNSAGSFSNSSAPMGVLENRQFNFARFYQRWAPVALAANTNTQILLVQPDSTYEWFFTGAVTASTNIKHPTIVFNTVGAQTASLNVRYTPQVNRGQLPSVLDATSETITVSSNAAPVIAIAGPTAMCAGTQATLTASGNTTFTWTSPPTQTASIVISPTVTTTYSVSAENMGCVGSQTMTILVNTAPTVAVSSPTSGCVGTTFMMTASGANAYVWNNGITTASNIVSTTVTPVANFTVIGEKQGCPSHTLVFGVPINVKPEVELVADLNIMCSKATTGTSVALTGFPAGGTYSGANVSGPKFTPGNAGQFVATYSYTDAVTGCANKATTQLTVVTCDITSLNKDALNTNVIVFPNPAVNGKVTVTNLDGSNEITVYNILGSVVSKETGNGSQYNVDLSSQSAGTYFMRITDANGGVKTVKIVNSK